MSRIILASKSAHRAALLKNAGVKFIAIAADIDERAVEAPLIKSALDGADVASVLARAKAIEVSSANPNDTVIGCDQTLTLDGELLHKPANMEEARRRLLQLSGKTHYLNSAAVLAKQGKVVWDHVEIAAITFHALDPGFIGRHLAEAGEEVLSSVGAYQIEGPGIQLFEKMEGDYFSIIGLPLLPLLARLRQDGLLENQDTG